jgi:four helix bundle protein
MIVTDCGVFLSDGLQKVNDMDEKTFKAGTRKFAVVIIKQVDQLSRSPVTDVIARQLIRSGTSIGANYRAACRAKSTPDMINKLKIVEEESDETENRLELLMEAKLMPQGQIADIYRETDEIPAMTAASIKTLRARKS